MKISVLGNGNLAQNLCILLKNSKHEIVEIYDRNAKELDVFCKEVNAKPVYQIQNFKADVDLIVISITDDAIETVLKEIQDKSSLIVHTSGSVPVDVFKTLGFSNYGVIYPLYSFSKKNRVDFKSIPFLLEANNSENARKLQTLIESITDHYCFADSGTRSAYHLVAIFVNNFTNYLLGTAQELTEIKALDFGLLKPILQQTANNAIVAEDIHSIQTGPAVRNNERIIEKHKDILATEKTIKDLYAFLTQKIIDKHKS